MKLSDILQIIFKYMVSIATLCSSELILLVYLPLVVRGAHVIFFSYFNL